MKIAVFILIFILTAFQLFSVGIRESNNMTDTTSEKKQDKAKENAAKILGRVQVYGNEPHTFVGIVDETGTEYAVYPKEQEDRLRSLQGHIIEFTVIFLDEPKTYGSLFLRGGTVEVVSWLVIPG